MHEALGAGLWYGEGKKTLNARSNTHLEEFRGTPINTDTFTLVQIRFVVFFRNALGMARVDETVAE